MKNTHVISFDWGSVHIYTTLTSKRLTDLMTGEHVCIFTRFVGAEPSEIIINMKLVGCIYPLEQ